MNESSRFIPDSNDLAAQQICRRHAKSFYFASKFLPRRKRFAAYAVYAFCRLLDDAVDEAGTPAEQVAGLSRFRSILGACVEGRPPDDQPALIAFARVINNPSNNLDRSHFEDLARGCEMDLTITRYDTWLDLETYCYRVAGVVGLMMCGVFGLGDPSARQQAIQMGNAMQLTNILRDVGEDFSRGRIYLPREEWIGDMGKAIAAREVTPDFVATMARQVERARRMFQEAAQGLRALPDDGSRKTACVMAVVYAGILGEIERQKYDVLNQRSRLSFLRKIMRLPKAFKLARSQPGEAVPDVF